MRLDGRVAVVTGGGSGIGAATAALVTGTHVGADGGLWAHSGMPPIGGLGPDF